MKDRNIKQVTLIREGSSGRGRVNEYGTLKPAEGEWGRRENNGGDEPITE
jgi:hypothetical protein